MHAKVLGRSMTRCTSRSLRRPNRRYRFMMTIIGPLLRLLRHGCQSFARCVSDQFERPLSRVERFRQAMHRMMCSLCRTHEQRMQQLHRLTLELSSMPPEPDNRPVGDAATDTRTTALSKDAQERMRRALQDCARSASEPPTDDRSDS